MNIGTASSSMEDMPWSIWLMMMESGMVLVKYMKAAVAMPKLKAIGTPQKMKAPTMPTKNTIST